MELAKNEKIISKEDFEQCLAISHYNAEGNVDARVFLDFGKWLEQNH